MPTNRRLAPRRTPPYCLLPVGLALLLVGCVAGPRWSAAFSDDQVRSIAREIARNTPSQTGPDGRSRFTWMLLLRPQPDPNPTITRSVEGELRRDYRVFTTFDSIPADSVVRRDGRVVGFRSGFSFKFTVTALKNARLRVQYVNYWSAKGGTIQTITYAWIGGVWKAVEVGPMGLSRAPWRSRGAIAQIYGAEGGT